MMVILSDEEILKEQRRIKRQCELEIFEFFDSAEELINSMFPKSGVKSKGSTGDNKMSVDSFVLLRIGKFKQWIESALDQAIFVSGLEEFDEQPPENIEIPNRMAHKVIQALLKILSAGRDLTDNGLLFVSGVGEALSIPRSAIDTMIEQIQMEKRKQFTNLLIEYLDADERYWVALMLSRAIHVDHRIHPREYKYFENIAKLLDYDQAKLDQLQIDSENFLDVSAPTFDQRWGRHIYRYIVEIVMVDEEYVSEESAFIQELGKKMRYNKTQQDEIIQPVASALMLRRSLFSY